MKSILLCSLILLLSSLHFSACYDWDFSMEEIVTEEVVLEEQKELLEIDPLITPFYSVVNFSGFNSAINPEKTLSFSTYTFSLQKIDLEISVPPPRSV